MTRVRSLTRRALLEDYTALTRRRGIAAESMALRTESIAMRDLLAFAASDGRMSWEQLRSAQGTTPFPELEPYWLASLARVCALQNFHDDDREFALRALSVANRALPHDGKSQRFRELEFHLRFVTGQFEHAHRLLLDDPSLGSRFYNYYENDLQNPWLRNDPRLHPAWLEGFNAPFLSSDLSPVLVIDGPGLPFDRLEAENRPAVTGPLVSVVVTAYQPERNALLNSVRSILAQTWQSLEVIIVDDASGGEYGEIFEQVVQLDKRVRLIRMPNNGGTYLARNVGIRASLGEYVTGQDADDWSHPERLERQARPLLGDSSLPGTRVYAIATDENLIRTRPGYVIPFYPNASSLMVRTDIAKDLGGHLPARKAADNEFLQRVERYSGTDVALLESPLSIVRIQPNSLSRSDFRAGWSHPARRSFRQSYENWHEASTREGLKHDDGSGSPVPIPRRFVVNSGDVDDLDVVFAADWRQYGGPQISMLNEIAALRARGYRVGVLHMEAARFMSVRPGTLCAAVQDLINADSVREVMYDDSTRIRLLILRYPPVLQFPPRLPSELIVRRWIILANQAPAERDGSEIRYIPADCSANGEVMFGSRAVWVPQGPTVRRAIQSLLPSDEVADFDMPGILDPSAWWCDRSYFRATVPVVGRHSRDHSMKWPHRPSAIEDAYPLSGAVDVRIMGGASVPLERLGSRHTPPGWVVFEKDELPVHSFLNSIDFFVYFQNPVGYEAFGRAVLEALATGCVAILPQRFEATFGDAAIYAEPSNVQNIISEFYENPEQYERQSALAVRRVKERFGYDAYADLVSRCLSVSTQPGANEVWSGQ